ncbi:MAG: FKBP-type peptidyl-prolyl cis-trans isomerase [Candidatus Acidiferrales bacterium]
MSTRDWARQINFTKCSLAAIRRFANWGQGCQNRKMCFTRKNIFSAIGVAGAALLFGTFALAHQPPTAGAQTTQQSSPGTAGTSHSASNTKHHAAASSASSGTLTTDKQKESYALGMNIAHRLKDQPVDLDRSALLQGFKDELAGGKMQLTDDEASVELKQLSAEADANSQKKEQAAGEANMKEGEEFLAANKTKKGVKVLPSGLQYKIEKEGTGPKPTASDTVVCNYRGTFLNGTEFDSSYKRGQPATFPVGGVIKGWTEALQLMPVGSKWELFIPSDLAYGPRGAGGVIGPNATLVFEVELLSIKGANTGTSK